MKKYLLFLLLIAVPVLGAEINGTIADTDNLTMELYTTSSGSEYLTSYVPVYNLNADGVYDFAFKNIPKGIYRIKPVKKDWYFIPDEAKVNANWTVGKGKK